MKTKQNIPILFRLLYGEGEELEEEARGEMQGWWARAFEDWLEQVRHDKGRKQGSREKCAWGNFLRDTHKGPWEVEQEDVEKWAEERMAGGIQSSTIWNELAALKGFYEYINRAGGDESEALKVNINPAKGVRRPSRVASYGDAPYLSREEALRLLGAIDREETTYGKRDYALILAHLMTGQKSGEIRKLRWGNLKIEEGAVWIRWRRGSLERQDRMPMEVWEAMRDYLTTTGRLEMMKAEDYIFAPAIDWMRTSSRYGGRWDSSRPIAVETLNLVLKQYARQAGLKAEAVDINILRHTAAMLRVEAGDDAQAIRDFLGLSSIEVTRGYLRKMTAQAEIGAQEKEEQEEAEVTGMEEGGPLKGALVRKPGGGQPGAQGRLRHGLFARTLPSEEIEAQMGKEGLGEAIARLRVVMERAFRLSIDTEDPREAQSLLEVYGKAVIRLAGLLRAEKAMETDDFQATVQLAIAEVAKELGIE